MMFWRNKVGSPHQKSPKALDTAHPALAFDHVQFRYHHAEEPALRDIDVQVKGGQTLAIIGGTGSGKTTMVNLIPRFYDVEKGAVRVDGEDVKAVDLKKLHEAVAFRTAESEPLHRNVCAIT